MVEGQKQRVESVKGYSQHVLNLATKLANDVNGVKSVTARITIEQSWAKTKEAV
jgi:excinuclease UvrABC ATPase subunit